jgi:hypothetical protein
MKGAYKDFDPDLYNEFDSPAKDAMREHLLLKGHDRVVVPREDFGPDLYSFLCGMKMYHEVEVSRGWANQMDFPFEKGSVPERKKRLANLVKDTPLYFWMLRKDLRRAVVFSSVYLRHEYLVEVKNRMIAEGEFFYRIPLKLGKEFDLLPLSPNVEIDWEAINGSN